MARNWHHAALKPWIYDLSCGRVDRKGEDSVAVPPYASNPALVISYRTWSCIEADRCDVLRLHVLVVHVSRNAFFAGARVDVVDVWHELRRSFPPVAVRQRVAVDDDVARLDALFDAQEAEMLQEAERLQRQRLRVLFPASFHGAAKCGISPYKYR